MIGRLLLDINLGFVFLSFILSSGGFLLSSYIVRANIKILKFYPLWILKKILPLLNPEKRSFSFIFLFIFFANSFSDFLFIISGFTLILPFLLAFYLGIYLGVPIFGGEELPSLDVRPSTRKISGYFVLGSLLCVSSEMLAHYISLAVGMKIASINFPQILSFKNIAYFFTSMEIYFRIIIPLLLLSAFLEAKLVK